MSEKSVHSEQLQRLHEQTNSQMQIPVDFKALSHFCVRLAFLLLDGDDNHNNSEPQRQWKNTEHFFTTQFPFSYLSIVCNSIQIFCIPKESKCAFSL